MSDTDTFVDGCTSLTDFVTMGTALATVEAPPFAAVAAYDVHEGWPAACVSLSNAGSAVEDMFSDHGSLAPDSIPDSSSPDNSIATDTSYTG